MFPYLPGQSGYNKRLKKLAGMIAWLTGQLATLHWASAPKIAGVGRDWS